MRPIILSVALMLAGCAHPPPAPLPVAPADAPKPIVRTVVKQVCVPWHKWSDAELKELHDALIPVPDGTAIIRMAHDWYRYYDAAKACTSAQQ